MSSESWHVAIALNCYSRCSHLIPLPSQLPPFPNATQGESPWRRSLLCCSLGTAGGEKEERGDRRSCVFSSPDCEQPASSDLQLCNYAQQRTCHVVGIQSIPDERINGNRSAVTGSGVWCWNVLVLMHTPGSSASMSW